MPTVFLTGFPGFLGSSLIPRLLDRYADDTSITCLIQAKFRAQAEARAAAIEDEQPSWSGRIHLVDGDITRPDLGLGDRYEALQRDTVEIFHLAAVYDLGVRRELGMRVNVDGTRHMLRFAEGCADLHRFQYISTCYVSGRYNGLFTEDHLVEGQVFNNHYESTKYLAEVEVQQAMRQGLPTTIYRPSIVVGNSRTGAMQKYDGPYYIIRWILRWSRVAPVPVMGDPDRYTINVVPSDFVVDAITYLSGLDRAKNTVYQLAAPAPPTVRKMIATLEAVTGRRLLTFHLPRVLAKMALQYLPLLQRWMQIEPAAVDYFSHPASYATRNTQRDLADSGITCPPFEAYAGRLVTFVQQNPEISSAAMV